jgi:hypothetical protein
MPLLSIGASIETRQASGLGLLLRRVVPGPRGKAGEVAEAAL